MMSPHNQPYDVNNTPGSLTKGRTETCPTLTNKCDKPLFVSFIESAKLSWDFDNNVPLQVLLCSPTHFTRLWFRRGTFYM